MQHFETEDALQAASIDLISKKFPQFEGKRWHTQNELIVPKRVNESPKQYNQRVLMIGAQNKRKGKLAGVPDILIKYKGILYCIELKLPSGTLQDSQKLLHETWNLDFPQIPVFVARSLEDVEKICNWIINSGFKIIK